MAPSPVSGLRRPAPLLAVEVTVDQTNHGAHARRVRGAVVPVRLAQAFVATRAPDAVLDDDARARRPGCTLVFANKGAIGRALVG